MHPALAQPLGSALRSLSQRSRRLGLAPSRARPALSPGLMPPSPSKERGQSPEGGRGQAAPAARCRAGGGVTAGGPATASTALSASGICVGAFAGPAGNNGDAAFSIAGAAAASFRGAAVAGTAATAGGTASAVGVAYTGYVVAAAPPGGARTMCVGGACGGQAPT